MYDRFGYPGLFAAYNAGPARYERHLRTGQALPAETRDYIAQLAKVPATPSMPPAVLSGTRLFFPLGGAENAARKEPEPAPARTDSIIEQPASGRSEEHTSELQSLMRLSYAVFCLKKKKQA